MNTGITFDDVYGMDEAKNYLESMICQAIMGQETTGLLMFGVSIFLC